MSLFLFACDPVADEIIYEPGSDYFPLRVGAFTTYQVDSTHIQLNVESKFTFQLRLTVADSFKNGTGDYTYVINREKRADASKPWVAAGTWSAWVSLRQAVAVEGNQSFVKLQFPIREGLRWNGNALNAEEGEELCDGTTCDRYEVIELRDTYNPGTGVIVGPAAIVLQSNEPDVLVKQDLRNEVYAKDIGLVYKEMIVLNYCTTETCFGKQFVDSGIKYKQQLLTHGAN